MVDKLEACPQEITYNPVYNVTYQGAYPSRGYVYRRATPANGEQVERAKEVAHRIVCEFRPAGWPAKEGEIARLLMQTFPTPTEDARERVKVLEEALAFYAKPSNYGVYQVQLDKRFTRITDDAGRRARTALGNKETDRHG